jgi:cytosine/uracil/thiamine/allantoin permease
LAHADQAYKIFFFRFWKKKLGCLWKKPEKINIYYDFFGPYTIQVFLSSQMPYVAPKFGTKEGCYEK